MHRRGFLRASGSSMAAFAPWPWVFNRHKRARAARQGRHADRQARALQLRRLKGHGALDGASDPTGSPTSRCRPPCSTSAGTSGSRSPTTPTARCGTRMTSSSASASITSASVQQARAHVSRGERPGARDPVRPDHVRLQQVGPEAGGPAEGPRLLRASTCSFTPTGGAIGRCSRARPTSARWTGTDNTACRSAAWRSTRAWRSRRSSPTSSPSTWRSRRRTRRCSRSMRCSTRRASPAPIGSSSMSPILW